MVCNSQSSTIIEFMAAADEFGEAAHDDDDDAEEILMFEWGL